MDDFVVMNEIYASYFEGGNYPARETVGGSFVYQKM